LQLRRCIDEVERIRHRFYIACSRIVGGPEKLPPAYPLPRNDLAITAWTTPTSVGACPPRVDSPSEVASRSIAEARHHGAGPGVLSVYPCM
jgi:hypothetical protein